MGPTGRLMNTIERLEIEATSEKKLRLRCLELAVQAHGPGNAKGIVETARGFTAFLVGTDELDERVLALRRIQDGVAPG